jgi:SAM-dependent methyltransferase
MNSLAEQLEPLAIVDSPQQETQMLARRIGALGNGREALSILEAGCGNSWQLKLPGVRYILTGVDLSQEALNIRKYERGDLDRIIRGDLRTVDLEDGEYDVIYNSFVLEHVQQAEQVLCNFLRWLKPGGILVLRIPDPQSVYGFLARITPFWFHVFYKRYVAGMKMAGKPGYDPFPTAYDDIVSRAGIRSWCAEHGMIIREEVGWGYRIAKPGPAALITWAGIRAMNVLSFGALAANHVNLTYVIEKPAVKKTRASMPCNPMTLKHRHEPACK